MADIIDGIADVTSVMGDVFTTMTSNPLLVFFLSATLVVTGVRVFKKLRGAAR